MVLSKVSYGGWLNCYRLANDKVELLLTSDVGPRVLHFAFLGQENQLQEYPTDLGKTGGEDWRPYGGHRFWHAPEAQPRTYFPDNFPVVVEDHGDFIRLVQPIETTTGIQKEIDIHLAASQAGVTLRHRLRNTNLWPVEMAPWALTLMRLGGTAIIPLSPRGAHEANLLPTDTLTLWAYTNLSDPRLNWGEQVILVHQDAQATTPQKIGVLNKVGWLAYQRAKTLFVKRFDYQPGARYPDLGCSVEVFTRWDMIELETLGPLAHVAPGEAVEHIEGWYLFDGLPFLESPLQVGRDLLPLIETTR